MLRDCHPMVPNIMLYVQCTVLNLEQMEVFSIAFQVGFLLQLLGEIQSKADSQMKVTEQYFPVVLLT